MERFRFKGFSEVPQGPGREKQLRGVAVKADGVGGVEFSALDPGIAEIYALKIGIFAPRTGPIG
jgi:hypothetical protein